MKIFLKNLAIASIVIYVFSFGLCSTKDIIDSVVLNYSASTNPLISFDYTIPPKTGTVQSVSKSFSYAQNDSIIKANTKGKGDYSLANVQGFTFKAIDLEITSPATGVDFNIVDKFSLQIMTRATISSPQAVVVNTLDLFKDATLTINPANPKKATATILNPAAGIELISYLNDAKPNGEIAYTFTVTTKSVINVPVVIKAIPTYSLTLVP